MKKLLLILLCLPFIGFGQVIGGLDYSLTAKDVQISNCLMPSQIFPCTPEGLTYDGEFLWYSLGGTITKVDLLNNSINNFNLAGVGTGGLCFDGINLWKVDEQTAKLYRLDTNGLMLDSFLLPSSGFSDPNGWGIAWDGNYIWHSEYGFPNSSGSGMRDSTKFYKMNPFNGQILHSFSLPYWILGIEFVNGKLHAIKNNPSSFPVSQKYIIDINTESYIDSVEWCIASPAGLTFTGIDFWSSSSHLSNSPGIYQFLLISTNIKEIDKYKKNLLKVTDLLGRETKGANQPLFYIYDDGTVEKRIVID